MKKLLSLTFLLLTGCSAINVKVPPKPITIHGYTGTYYWDSRSTTVYGKDAAGEVLPTPQLVAATPESTDRLTRLSPVWMCTGFDAGTTLIAHAAFHAKEANPLGLGFTLGLMFVTAQIEANGGFTGQQIEQDAFSAVHCAAGIWNVL